MMKTCYVAFDRCYDFYKNQIWLFAFEQNYLPLATSATLTSSVIKFLNKDTIAFYEEKLLSTSDELWVVGVVTDEMIPLIRKARLLDKSVKFVDFSEDDITFSFVSTSEVRFAHTLNRYDQDDLMKMIS